jgi:hypothetical protein
MTIRMKCPCGKVYNFADRFSGTVTKCVICDRELIISDSNRREAEANQNTEPVAVPEAPMETMSRDISDNSASLCQICLCPLEEIGPLTQCPECKTIYHTECWQENGGCGIYGCTHVPAIENHNDLEEPISYWGRETKPCPECKEEIMATALRCRHCGTIFESADPAYAEQLYSTQGARTSLPGMKRRTIVLFIFCLIPFSAAIAALIALGWKKAHAAEFRRLPSMYEALCNIGVAIGLGQTAFIMIAAVFYAALGS